MMPRLRSRASISASSASRPFCCAGLPVGFAAGGGVAGVPGRAAGPASTGRAAGRGGAAGLAGAFPSSTAGRLRRGDPPVLARVHGGHCLIDLRCVPEDADERLVEAVLRAQKAQ